jgi:prolyl oligopeptidase
MNCQPRLRGGSEYGEDWHQGGMKLKKQNVFDDFIAADAAEEFKALYAYSPLHNIKPGTCYPPTLVTTANHDDRVVPSHSFKFAATMQAAQGCANPVLIRIETRAGHGAGKPTSKQIEEVADRWGFLVRALNMNVTGA